MGSLSVPGFSQAINWTTLVTSLGNLGALQGVFGPWRPPQWNQGALINRTEPYSLTVKLTTEATSHEIFDSSGNPIGNSSGNPNIRKDVKSVTYFFDAILRAEHRQELRKTEHPVQSGASIMDHAYLMPARISLEIGVSDCMARFVAGQFTSNSSKSISAYQTLLDLQKQRVPLTLTTRLNNYDNLVIESIGAVETYQTQFSLRAVVLFAQIIIAQTATQTVSARPDATDLTNEGTKQPLPPDSDMFTPTTEQALAGFQ